MIFIFLKIINFPDFVTPVKKYKNYFKTTQVVHDLRTWPVAIINISII